MKSKGKLIYRMGDATAPQGKGPMAIAHVCNDLGRWGKGFVVCLSNRWPITHERYFAWHRGKEPDAAPFELGAVQFVEVRPKLWVANMIGQHRITRKGGVPPVRYEAIKAALTEVAKFAVQRGATVHMPRIGCGQAGGNWHIVSEMITRFLCERGLSVTVYDPPGTKMPDDQPSLFSLL